MSTSIRVEEVRNLVRTEALQYIRPIEIELGLWDARPDARMYVFFGGQDVTYLCNLFGNEIGTPLVTDSDGRATIILNIPPTTFNTGEYEIIIADVDNLDFLDVTGSVFGSARGIFTSSGTQEFYQTTLTTVTTVVRRRPPESDPLAQSFFTYGNPNGIFLTAIDLYFQAKDDSLPVIVDVRPLVNGYPLSYPLPGNNFRSSVSANNVVVSDDASAPTKFIFNPPIYLPGDSDFCFVVFSNSKEYNLYTSRLGERSIENGLIIFDQPYVGSLFRSENDITWTADQYEDLKFDIYRADFNTSSATLEFSVDVPYISSLGEQFVTTANSATIRYTHSKKHGLDTSSYIELIANTNYSYNGIDGANLTGTFAVTSVIDDNTVEFDVNADATSNGQITSANAVTFIYVTSGGSGYSNTATVTFTGGGGGSGAVANVVVDSAGTIKEIIVSNPGSGYTINPSVSISGTGSGATALAYVQPIISVKVNKPMHAFSPNIKIYNFGTTKTRNTFETTIGNYSGGSLTSYTSGKTIPFSEEEYYVDLKQNSLIASDVNEELVMANNKSGTISIDLITNDSRVSPVIDSRYIPELIVYNKKVNANTTDETLPGSGAAQSRYITKKINLETVSNGIRLFSDITSYQSTSVNWYIKTSLSSSGLIHEEQDWQLLSCDVERNRSGDNNEIFEYEFYLNNIPDFDIYSLKCVLTASNPVRTPIVHAYRVIVIA